jgi:hypothetical protein
VTRNAEKPPLNVRQFKLDGYAFSINGENDKDGVYRAVIETPDGAHRNPDMMHALIRRMRSGQPVVEGRGALKNLEWMLQILDFARE